MNRIRNLEELLFAIRTLARSGDAEGLSAIARRTPPSDLAEALAVLPPDGQAALLARLPPDERARVFRHLDPGRQDALLGRLPEPVLRELFAGLPADERADLFKRLDEPRRARLLPALGRAEREDLLRLAAYPEGSVGSVTTTGMVALPPALTVREAFARLRALAPRAETLGVIYVVDEGSRLLGTVSLRELVLADEEARIGELMRPDPVVARPEWPRAEAAELIRRHDLVALPVVDGEGRLIGIVTVDDAMDIEKAEEAATLTRFGGSVAATGGPDLDLLASPLRRLFGVRAFWLAVLTFFGVLTSSFVAAQEELLAQAIVLAAFIAPIIDMGGNAGSQSATLVIRSMALGQLAPRARDLLLVLRRELPVAAALGLCIALLEAVLALFSKGVGLEVLLVVGLAMLACTLLGGLIGAVLPFAARRIGTDPATLSAPLITSIMDLLGVMLYFAIAWLLLGDGLGGAT